MQILNFLSGAVILLFCIFLIGLAVLIVVKSKKAEQFLSAFASSARTHYTEQIARLIVGLAIVVLAPYMWYSNMFTVFGWILVVTSIGLMLIPWHWHHKYGKWAIPLALRFMKVFAFGAFLLGVLVLFSLSKVLVS